MTYANLIAQIQRHLQSAPDGMRHENAFIAGGALRDIDCGIAPKDIDIFCVIPADEAAVHAFLNYLVSLDLDGFEIFTEMVSNDGEPYAENLNGVMAVYESVYSPPGAFEDTRNSITVQVVFYESAYIQRRFVESFRKTITDEFDLNICRVASFWNSDSDKIQILKSPLYKDDLRGRVVTLNQSVGVNQTQEMKNKTRTRARRISDRLGFRYSVDYEAGLRRQEEMIMANMRFEASQQAALNNMQRAGMLNNINNNRAGIFNW